jgi:isoquinoline 1-oxidoreductase alpha subunit
VTELTINDERVKVDADPSTPLLWVIREQLGLTGTKYACGVAQCGACTVHIDGQAVRSCIYPLSAVTSAQKITTIEGLSKNADHPVQRAWAELDTPQCGYCQPGMIMAASALLASTPNPTDADIDAQITNICRCGTFQRVREGVHLAAKIAQRKA